jgi:hypothetical protein
MHNSIIRYNITPNSILGPFQHLRLPVQLTPSKTTKSVRELPLLAPQLPQGGSNH